MNASDLVAAFDLLPAQIAILDETGAITGTNRAWKETAREGSLGNQGGWNYLDECRAAARRGCAEAAKVADGIRLVLSGSGDTCSFTYACPFKGRHHWFQVIIAPSGQDGRPGAVVMHVNVTGLEHDALTDLPNRVLFNAQADLSLRSAMQDGSATGILLIDLNRFKPVNDRFGHLAGDQVLRTVAVRLRASVRDQDVPARFGGDEFGVVLSPGTDPAVTEQLMLRVKSALEQPVVHKGQALSVGVSIGAGMYPADGSTVAELIAVADTRMYGMKNQRRLA